MYDFILNSPIGNLGLQVNDNDVVTKLDFLLDTFVEQAKKQVLPPHLGRPIKAYFNHKSKSIELPVELEGTPFQQKVWYQLQQIPYGATMSYGQLAKQLKTCAQAIGNACRANPVPLLVPCHRIVAATGLGGFSGTTQGKLLDVKRWLLKHEQQIVS